MISRRLLRLRERLVAVLPRPLPYPSHKRSNDHRHTARISVFLQNTMTGTDELHRTTVWAGYDPSPHCP